MRGIKIKITKISHLHFLFVVIFGLLFYVYFPVFFYPPRSDYWSTSFFFHSIDSMGFFAKLNHLSLYDPFSQIRFQPLAYPVLYLEWLIFGANFVYFQITNFIVYCLSIVLFYRLAKNFCQDKILVLLLTAAFSFLFSHFDIICWSYHIYIIIAVCFVLSGLIEYFNFLKTGRKYKLFLSLFFLISGVLCYETFILLPASILLINYLHSGNTDKKYSLSIKRMILIAVLAAYGFYLFLFFIIKNFNIYNSPLTSISDIFNIRNILIGFSSAWFNLAYNGFLVNAAPILAVPLTMDENINLGLFFNSVFEINPVVLISIGGSIVSLSMIYFLIYLYKGGQRQYLKLTLISLTLYFSQAFTLLFLRLATNDIYFGITQFRYTYMFNIFTFLLAAVLISFLMQLCKKLKSLIVCGLLLIMMFNILIARNYGLKLLNDQLAPLSSMLYSIKINLENGAINKEHKLFIDDNIVNFLPRLCWNREMGEKFMYGTYQWVFPRKYINNFSFSNQDAYWVIDKETFDIVRR